MLFPQERLLIASLPLRGYRTRYVRTSAGRIHTYSAKGFGSLPPVVLLHGIASAAVHLLPLLAKLRPHVEQLIAIDLAGHGVSDTPGDGLTPESLAASLVEALDEVTPSRFVFFGSSLGGACALRYALERPERVVSMVLASPAGAPMPEEEYKSFLRSLRMETPRLARDFMRRVFVRPPYPWPMLTWGTRLKFRDAPVLSLLENTGLEDSFTEAQLASITAPTLLVWPPGDRVFPTSAKDFFVKHIRNVTLDEPLGVGHSPYLEDVRTLSEPMLRFMRAQRARA